MTDHELFARIESRLDGPAQRALAAVRPIYQMAPSGFPELVGSGVLLRFGSDVALVTAAHVTDQERQGALLFPPGSSFRTLGETRYVTLPPEGDRTNDRFDIAVIAMDEVQRSELDPTTPMTESDLRVVEKPSHAIGAKTKYVAIGFPKTKQPRRPPHGTLRAEAIRPILLARSESAYAELRADPATHLALEYNRKDFSIGDQDIEIVDPHGMSGGGVWRIENMLGPTEPRLFLVGIITEFHRAPMHSMVATRLGTVLNGISRLFPHLTSRLRLLP